MKLQKIKISFLYFVLPGVLLSGFVLLLLCSCTKKNTSIIAVIVPVNNMNTDSMANDSIKKYLALGDSYTIGTSVTLAESYPVQTTALLKSQGINITDPKIIATNGWTTVNLINGINSTPVSNTYDVVSLLIGVNDQYQGATLAQYKQQFTTLIQRSIQLAKGMPGHVFIISIPDYSVTPFAKGRNVLLIAKEIDEFNNANKAIASSYNVNYLYITDESRKAASDPSLIASDSLHFSSKEYAIWSGMLAPMIKSALK